MSFMPSTDTTAGEPGVTFGTPGITLGMPTTSANALAIHPEPRWVLKKLRQKHKTIVALHLQHMKREDIGRIAACTPEYVSMLLQQPLVQAYLRELEQYMDTRLRSLYSKSVDAIDDCLGSGDDKVKLAAARLQLEATNKLGNAQKDEDTAEDIVARILSGVTVQVHNEINVGNTGVQHDSSGISILDGEAEVRIGSV